MKTKRLMADSMWRLLILPIAVAAVFTGCIFDKPQKTWQREAAEKACAELNGEKDDVRRGAIRDYVKALISLEKGGDPDRRFSQGRTLLMMAVIRDDKEIVERLLSLDVYADVNMVDEEEETPLIVACRKGYADIVKRLIKAGAQVNSQNKDGTSALMICAYYGDRDIAMDVLKAGADRALKDKEGATFADYARRKNRDGKNHEYMIALIEGFQFQEARQ